MFYIVICVFQVQDLAVASPATVSRCGMVYVDPDELKWMPYVQTWITGLGAKVVYTATYYNILSGFAFLIAVQALNTFYTLCSYFKVFYAFG